VSDPTPDALAASLPDFFPLNLDAPLRAACVGAQPPEPTDSMGETLWSDVEKLRGWLDEEAAPASAGDVKLLRVLKIGEEFGEVAEALHGALGANPRKGRSHTWQDVEKELCDVIVTAMVALATVTPDGEKLLEERLRHLVARAMPGEGTTPIAANTTVGGPE
jgi:NTP pyrophosphatase (non-canonical NTP hydrolase)